MTRRRQSTTMAAMVDYASSTINPFCTFINEFWISCIWTRIQKLKQRSKIQTSKVLTSSLVPSLTPGHLVTAFWWHRLWTTHVQTVDNTRTTHTINHKSTSTHKHLFHYFHFSQVQLHHISMQLVAVASIPPKSAIWIYLDIKLKSNQQLTMICNTNKSHKSNVCHLISQHMKKCSNFQTECSTLLKVKALPWHW